MASSAAALPLALHSGAIPTGRYWYLPACSFLCAESYLHTFPLALGLGSQSSRLRRRNYTHLQHSAHPCLTSRLGSWFLLPRFNLFPGREEEGDVYTTPECLFVIPAPHWASPCHGIAEQVVRVPMPLLCTDRNVRLLKERRYVFTA